MSTAATSPTAVFDEAFLRQLERLRLVAARQLPTGLEGEHRSRQRGAGMEFADYRPYVAGDDIRAVDWSAYLRLDKLLVRQFDDEGDLKVYIFLDQSESMGRTAAFTLGRQIAASLAYLALSHLDRVSIVLYAHGATQALFSLRGTPQVWRIFSLLEDATAAGETYLELALRQTFSQPRRRGLVVLISDFLAEETRAALDLLLSLGHEALVVHLGTSTVTTGLDSDADLLLIDAESGDEIQLPASATLGADLATAEQQHQAELAGLCRRNGWRYLHAGSDCSCEEIVLRVMRREGALE